MSEASNATRWRPLSSLALVVATATATGAVETHGQVPDAPAQHTVERGESLWEIAERYGTTRAALIRANGIEDPDLIRIGARLRIPDARSGDAPPRDEAGFDAAPEADLERKPQDFPPESIPLAALIDRCEAELRAARFEQALASAEAARRRIATQSEVAAESLRIRVEIASATAAVALGHNDAALESFARALAAKPDFELDPALTSPKLLAVFRAAQVRAKRHPR